MPKTVFEHDQFLGARQTTSRTRGFAVSRLVPTVPQDGVAEHSHAEAHFVLVLEGDYISSARGISGAAGAPILIYNPPGTVHRDCFRSETGLFVTVAVSLSALHEMQDVLTMPDYACVAGVTATKAALDLARSGCDELVLESHCVELMTATATYYEQQCDRAPTWLLRARDRLRAELASAPALADMARDCGVHPVYLARSFRTWFGCSPGEFQRRARLNRAAAMLTSDDTSMVEVAHACGYFDQAHFSRTFREAFALTPRQYRQRHRARRLRAGSACTRHPQGTHAE